MTLITPQAQATAADRDRGRNWNVLEQRHPSGLLVRLPRQRRLFLAPGQALFYWRDLHIAIIISGPVS